MRVAAMALAAGLAAPMAWGQASIIEITDPSPEPGTIIIGDLNADGSVAAGFRLLPGAGRAFRWTRDGGVEFIHDAVGGGDSGSSAAGVSTDGSVVVGQVGLDAFRWTRDETTLLGDLPGGDEFSSASAVSGDGLVVVGQSVHLPQPPDQRQPFRWTENTGMVGLGFPSGTTFGVALDTNSDGSVVVGDASGPGVSRAFVWTTDDGMGELPFFEPTETVRARAVSANGRFVVGGRSGGTPVGSAYRWSDLGIVDLGALPGDFRGALAEDVSADGSVVVGSTTIRVGSSLPSTAFVWTEASGTLSIEGVLVDCFGVPLDGIELRNAVAISSNGKVIAIEGVDASGRPAAFIVTLPIACRVDLDGDGVLTLFDFLLFQNFFDSDDRAADFDCDGELTVFDFLAFQNAFDAGCP